MIETTCADRDVHRRLVEGRNRHIEGVAFEPAWADIEERAHEYETPTMERLVLDADRPVEENLAAARAYVV